MSRRSFGSNPRPDGSVVGAAQAGERVSIRSSVARAANRTASGWGRVRAYAARSLHVWVIGAVGADLVRTAAWTRRSDPGAIAEN